MNKVRLFGAVLLMMCILTVPCLAEDEILESGDWRYYINDDGTATIDSFTGEAEEVIVPSEIDGVDVVTIGHGSFIWDNLTSIEIPDSVTTIGEYAFSGCESLTSIEIPDSVTTIGNGTFARCNQLADIKVSPNNKYYAVIDHALFDKKEMTLLAYPAGLDDDTYSIPSGTLSIGYRAFFFCDNLTSIEIPDSVTTI